MHKPKSENKQPIGNQGTLRDNGQGLLWRFIMEKLNRYIAPGRKGTPRGEQVGYPRDKYFAALLIALMGVSMREMAEHKDLRVSYDLLRKWATESEFKQLALKFREEFTERFIQHFRAHYEDDSKYWDGSYNEAVEKVLDRPDSREQRQKELEEFRLQDTRLYSPILLANIYKRIGAEISEGGTSASFFWLNLVNVLFSSSDRRSHYPWRKLHYALLRHLSISQLERTKSILLSRGEATPEDSQSPIRLLDQVQRFLEWSPTN